MKTEILYGVHSVLESIRAGRRNIVEIYFGRDKLSKRLKEIESRAMDLNIHVRRVDGPTIMKITGTDAHQGVAANVSPYPVVDIDDLIARSGIEKGNPFFLLLDTIVDAQNTGALIRTAVCAGADGVIVPKDRSAWLSPAVSRASAGALEHCLISRVTNLSTTIKQLKKAGIWIAGMHSDAGRHLFEADLTVPIAIVIGGEGKGLRPLVKKSCDLLMSIPQTDTIDSLNASAAGAVAMYEVYRQRNVEKASQ